MSKHTPWRPFRLSDSQAQAEIMRLAEDKRSLDVRDEFQNDPQRPSKFSRELDGVYIDMSKQRWDDEVLKPFSAWPKRRMFKVPLMICSLG